MSEILDRIKRWRLSSSAKARERDESLEKQHSRIIVYLGARMHYDAMHHEWDLPLVSPDRANLNAAPLVAPGRKRNEMVSEGEVSGGESRIRGIAAALENMKEEGDSRTAVILTTGGMEKTPDGKDVSRSAEAARKLQQAVGPSQTVESLGGVASTMGNAESVAQYVQEHRDKLGEVHEVEIATNDFHMLRAWIMFSFAMAKVATASLEKGKGRVETVEDLKIPQHLIEELSGPLTKPGEQVKVGGILGEALETRQDASDGMFERREALMRPTQTGEEAKYAAQRDADKQRYDAYLLWRSSLVRKTREEIIRRLEPYFEAAMRNAPKDAPRIRIRPLVVEDAIESMPGGEEEAGRIRGNEWVQATLGSEYRGVKQIFENTYKIR